MEFSLRYSGGLFEIKISGSAKPKIYSDSLDALFINDLWKPGTPLLVDETEMDAGLLTVKDVRTIAEIFIKRRTEFGPARFAIFVSRDLEYGMNRMWMVFVEEKWETAVDVFRSRDEAIAWLTV